MSGKTAVLLSADPLGAAAAVSEVLAEIRRVPVLDTAREARTCWGIVAENLREADARVMVAALAARGVGAFSMPAASIPPLPPVQNADRLDMDDAGFRCRLASGTTPPIPWSAVSMAAAAVLKKTTVTKSTRIEGPSAAARVVKAGILMTTGIPLPGGKTKAVEVRREETEIQAILDIALARPSGRLRMDASTLDFSSLGDRRGYDSLGNFRLLAAEVARRVSGERINHGARVILNGGAVGNMGYADLAEFEREERWLLASVSRR